MLVIEEDDANDESELVKSEYLKLKMREIKINGNIRAHESSDKNLIEREREIE